MSSNNASKSQIGFNSGFKGLMKNKYKIFVGNDGRATLIESNRSALESSANPVKDLKNLLGIS